MPLPHLRLPPLAAGWLRPINLRKPAARAASRFGHARRPYATQSRRPTTSSLLSETLDSRQRGSQRVENVGPFQLGLGQQTFAGQERPKPWGELSAGGKAVRATARTTNLMVILFGAGLTTVLIYALTSELFSSNSPTVLYNDACERVKASPRVARQIPGHLTFHTNPPSSLRPRHRNRSVASQLVRDSSGREHLLLSFYVQSSPNAPAASSYFEPFQAWITSIPTLSSDDIVSAARTTGERAKSLFKYLIGDSVPTQPVSLSSSNSQAQHRQDEPTGLLGSITGVFGSLRGPGRNSSLDGGIETGSQWQEGEVHVDFVKDSSGNFIYRYLIIDIPNSRIRNPVRIFVERADGVRETEPVMRWDAS